MSEKQLMDLRRALEVARVLSEDADKALVATAVIDAIIDLLEA